MNFLTMALVVIAITSCGKTSKVDIDLHGDRIAQLERQLKLEEAKNITNSLAISNLTLDISVLNQMIENEKQARIAGDDELAQALSDAVSILQDKLDQIKLDISNMGSTISKIINPCGNSGNFDELLLLLSSGEMMAWYLNVGLVELKTGLRYQTTDSQGCHFDYVQDGSSSKIISRGASTSRSSVKSYQDVPTGSVSSGIQLTCIADESILLNASKVRIRSSINQQVRVRQSSSNEVVVNVGPSNDTFVTFDSRGTVIAVPSSLGSQQTKACNN